MFPPPVVSTVFTAKRERFQNNYAFSLVVALNLTQIQYCYFLIGYYVAPFFFLFVWLVAGSTQDFEAAGMNPAGSIARAALKQINSRMVTGILLGTGDFYASGHAYLFSLLPSLRPHRVRVVGLKCIFTNVCLLNPAATWFHSFDYCEQCF